MATVVESVERRASSPSSLVMEKDVEETRTPTVAASESGGSPPMSTKEWIQFCTLCWTLFLAGYNDGTTGPLLPRIQSVYDVNYTVVSCLFISNCVGFVGGAMANIWLSHKLGFGKTIVLGSILQIISYAINSAAPPFPVFVVVYLLNGAGLALQDAQANGYVAAQTHNLSTKMGVMHGIYGLGALVSPLVATQFAELPRWSFHFLTSLGIGIINTIFLVIVFRGRTQNECLRDIGEVPHEEEGGAPFKQVMRSKVAHLLALFILIYVGVEVTIGGWTVTYIIEERGGGPSSGYISSGFFGGLFLGRVTLIWVNRKIGERRAIYIYSIICMALTVVVWRVPSLIGDAVAVSFVGFFLGPVYPIVMVVAADIIPPYLLTGSIGWIAGAGQSGSAALPFITGAIANGSGIWTLQPFLLGMIGLQMLLWTLVPRSQPNATPMDTPSVSKETKSV